MKNNKIDLYSADYYITHPSIRDKVNTHLPNFYSNFEFVEHYNDTYSCFFTYSDNLTNLVFNSLFNAIDNLNNLAFTSSFDAPVFSNTASFTSTFD